MLLLALTTASCASKTKKEKEKVLPPFPQRSELAPIETTADLVEALNYYEHLVQEWEAWGEYAQAVIDGE
jgi:hypothetical protein